MLDELLKEEESEQEPMSNDLEELERYTRLVQRVTNHLDWCKGTADRQDFEKRCTDSQNFWQGKHWSGISSYGIPGRSAERKKVKPSPVDNFFFSQIEGIVGDVCDQPADIIVEPTEESDEEIATLYNDVANHIWHVNRGDKALKFQVRRGILYGPMVAKVFWDSEWAGGASNPYVGEVRVTMFPPTQLFVDPRIKAVEPGVIQQAGFVIYGVRRSLHQIRETYPERGSFVTADSYASYISTLDPYESTYSTDPHDSSALVIEYYYRGKPLAPKFPATLEYDEFKDNRGEGVHLAVVAGNELLRHVPYIAPKYPFVMEWMYPSDDSIYCYGDGHFMLVPQLVINKSNEIAIEGNAIQAYGNWVTDEGNVRDVATFQRLAQTGGALLSFVDINRARRDMAGGVASSVFNQYNQEQRAMETVTGRLDISQGRAPRGIRAASAISMLLSQAAGRIKSRSDAVSSFVQQIMELSLMFAGKHYLDERTLRLKGPNGRPVWKNISADNLRKIKVYQSPTTGMMVEEEYIPEFDIKVIAGAETPTSRAYYAEMATQLFQAGAIDQEALLEVHKFPRWREVLVRMQTKAQAMQQAQAPAPGSMGMPQGPPDMGGIGLPQGIPDMGQGAGAIPPELLDMLIQRGEQPAPEEQMNPEMFIQSLLEEGVPPEAIQQILMELMAGGQEQPGMPGPAPINPGYNPEVNPQSNIGGGGGLNVLADLVNSLQRANTGY